MSFAATNNVFRSHNKLYPFCIVESHIECTLHFNRFHVWLSLANLYIRLLTLHTLDHWAIVRAFHAELANNYARISCRPKSDCVCVRGWVKTKVMKWPVSEPAVRAEYHRYECWKRIGICLGNWFGSVRSE